MRSDYRLSLLALLAAAAVMVLATACNGSTDDPGNSDNQVSVIGVSPTVACVDVDGVLTDTNGDGTLDNQVITSVSQTFNFDSRVRGASTDQGSVWNDVILDTVTLEYRMDDGQPGPAAWVNRPSTPIFIKAAGTSSYGMTTVKAGDIGPGTNLSTSGRSGAIIATFSGKDTAGNPVSTRCTVPLECVNICNFGK